LTLTSQSSVAGMRLRKAGRRLRHDVAQGAETNDENFAWYEDATFRSATDLASQIAQAAWSLIADDRRPSAVGLHRRAPGTD
jgi:hypothetical protein